MIIGLMFCFLQHSFGEAVGTPHACSYTWPAVTALTTAYHHFHDQPRTCGYKLAVFCAHSEPDALKDITSYRANGNRIKKCNLYFATIHKSTCHWKKTSSQTKYSCGLTTGARVYTPAL